MTLKTSNQPVLEVLNISKRFDMTQALEDVSLKMYPGEIHALVGENGAFHCVQQGQCGSICKITLV